MPLVCYNVFNRKHEDMSVFSYASLAALSELAYYWVSVVATVLIWKVPFGAYFLSDIPYELGGCLATFVCALPVAAIYKLMTKELVIGQNAKRPVLAPQI